MKLSETDYNPFRLYEAFSGLKMVWFQVNIALSIMAFLPLLE
ncbi:hypothetical protein EDE11_108147 [Methylomonas methanica]|uniref:Uncharacterized protein n=1 Tax=Methylomonas methanica TaxID=421 RepID=A0ABY2CMG6_METMH|nr:hypothetical protein EDE11_108147 [Methylomonas methanica]